MNTDNQPQSRGNRAPSNGRVRVLMHNRSNVFTQRGGDTVLMEHLRDGLIKRGVEVVIDLDGSCRAADFDIVHIFNFALPDLIRFFGERAEAAGKHFVVSTLNEDVPRFHNQSIQLARVLGSYVVSGQSPDQWKVQFEQRGSVEPAPRFENAWAADHATTLFSNGAGETRVLRREYGDAVRIKEVMLGVPQLASGSRERFVQAYGVEDFIFCVGRIETRKNQLMLLKALEHSDLPLVLAGGGFTYQPDYLKLVQSFKRVGKTIILDKISPEMLASAYQAARVHVLPSWYELPGLVSLEAALHGCAVVASDTGTTRDYLGERAWYCDPAHELSILNAVYAAYYGPEKSGIKEMAMKYSWDKTVEETLSEYHQILGISTAPAETVKTIDISLSTAQQPIAEPAARPLEELLKEGEEQARERNYNQAHVIFEEAERAYPRSVQARRARGAVYLAENFLTKARDCFQSALLLDERDSKSLSGLGMCDLHEGNTEGAYRFTVQALEIEPLQLVAILQLVQCSYMLERFTDLERVLRGYLAAMPADIEMRYCLAGCLYKLNRTEDAKEQIALVLARNARHQGALQLRGIMDEQSVAKAQKTEVAVGAATPISTAEIMAQLEEAKQQRRYEDVLEKAQNYLKSATINQNDCDAIRCYQAEAHAFSGQLDDADAIYQSILSANAEHSRALCGRGAIGCARGEFENSKVFFERALRADGKSDRALAGMGMVAQAGSDFEKAWELYRTALSFNPENLRALYGVIEIGYHFSRLSEMEESINTYLDYHPGDTNFLFALAGCLYRQGRVSEAESELAKVLLLEPGNERALEMRGVIEDRRAQARNDGAVSSASLL